METSERQRQLAFFQVWKDGPRSFLPPALGVPLDGVLAEYAIFHEEGAVLIPHGLSFEEAATLPCAGVTAWNANSDQQMQDFTDIVRLLCAYLAAEIPLLLVRGPIVGRWVHGLHSSRRKSKCVSNGWPPVRDGGVSAPS